LTQHVVGAGADPNDIQFTHTGAVDTTSGHSSTKFATITIPAGAEATLHCFVPIGCQQDHAHGPNEYPNMIDPQGGWTESSESYMENNGIERKRFFKKVVATNGPIECKRAVVHTPLWPSLPLIEWLCADPLHHTVHLGWGYVYLVELQQAGYCPVHTPPANKMLITNLKPSHSCGPRLVPYPDSCSVVHCDRSYEFGDWTNAQQHSYRNWRTDFFRPENEPNRRRNLWLVQDAHDVSPSLRWGGSTAPACLTASGSAGGDSPTTSTI